MPVGYRGVNFELKSIPRWICIREPNLIPIGTAVWHLSHIFECVTQMPLGGLEGFIFLAYVNSLVNLYTCAKLCADRSRGFGSFPRFMNWWPPNTAMPLGYQGVIFFSSWQFPDEYAYVCQIWYQSVQMFGIFPTFLYVWPTNPLQIPLEAREVTFFSRCPFPDKSANVCQIWSRSVQWFATGPSVTAKVSSVFSRCWRWLAQKHATKQHLYIENYNSGPNMLTSTSLPYFTAIFLAFRWLARGGATKDLWCYCAGM